MSRRIERDDHVLEIHREWIDITSALPRPSPSWTYTDAAGHNHVYGTDRELYPTLVIRTGEPYWCDECEDDHEDDWYECPLCGEKITPGSYVDSSPRPMPGPVHYAIDGEPVSEEQAQAFIAEGREARM